jgi:UDP-2,4-diacetamido-2,4,6-trideoxy-beta-L-altropyranose hydrolase
MPLAGRRVIDHVIARCRAITSVDDVVIATTILDADDAVADAARSAGAKVYRGDPNDVLLRYAEAAQAFSADIVLRVTSDCPLIDPEICDRVIRHRSATGADYASNNMPRLYPHGLDCEVFTRGTLDTANRSADDDYDREHVTPWIRRTPGITRASLIGPGWPSMQHRWTLDFAEDYDFFAALFPLLPQGRIPSTADVLTILADRPDIAKINAHRRVGGPQTKPPSSPVAVFRFEADAQTGLGHAMRCNALSTQLELDGWRCYWAVSPDTAAFLDSLAPPDSCIIVDAVAPADQIKSILLACGKCDLFVVDRYGASVALEAEMRKTPALTIALDDLADRTFAADIVVNPTPAINLSDYRGKIADGARVLAGPDFAILRSQFLAHRQQTLNRVGTISRPERVLVAFGGTDPTDGTGLALDVLETSPVRWIDVILGAKAPHLQALRHRITAMGDRVRLLVDVAEVAEVMGGVDLVIGAPGTGTWERACLGLPGLLVGIAENQRANAKSVVESGVGLLSGFLTTDSRDHVAARLRTDIDRVLTNPDLFHAMQAAAAALCDGRGVMRLAAALTVAPRLNDGTPLSLRLAESTDAEMLYRWQQAPQTRRFAEDKTPFTFEQHLRWLSTKLASDRDWLLLGEAGGIVCGFLRLDWYGEDRGQPQYLVSIAAAPDWYRRGVGRALLGAARRLMPSGHFYAKVLIENAASHSLFRACGYHAGDDGYYHATHHREQPHR